MGCPLIQGYVMSRPLTEENFLGFWTEREQLLGGAGDLGAATGTLTDGSVPVDASTN
jgi:hypothetical protein